MPTSVALEDLEDALNWLSFAPEYGNATYVSRSTGRCFSVGPDGPVDPDCPDDIGEDGTEYIAVPSKNELDLGKSLVFAFVRERASHLEGEVLLIFKKRGAYGRYKALLERARLLAEWHEYEQRATLEALEQWAQKNGFIVGRRRGAA